MHKITKNYFKYEKDTFVNIPYIYVASRSFKCFFACKYSNYCYFFDFIVYLLFQKYQKHPYTLLPILLLVDNSFAILFLALFFFSFKTKE